MKCGEPKPGGIYQNCDANLLHRGDHEYLGQKWPRPKPAEPDMDVEELIDSALSRSRELYEGPSYPVIVTETITRVLWVEAENEDRALHYWADDWSEVPLRDAEVLGCDLEFERPDKYQREDAFRSARGDRKVGPEIACPGCGRTAFRREWFHNPMRKCHGPIEWRETKSSSPRHQWRREFRATPVGGARQAVTA